MKREVLLGYHLLAGFSDTGAGVLLYVAPAYILRMMGVHAPVDALPYVSYIGAFVISVGLSYFYGALLVAFNAAPVRLETLWLLTALPRSAVAIYVAKAILSGQLEASWLSVAIFDGVCAVIQAIGLRKKWLTHAN